MQQNCIVLSLCFPGSSDGKESICNAGDSGSVAGSGRSLEKEMATLSNILGWEISWTEEPGGVQSMGSHRVGHDCASNTDTHPCVHQSNG